MEDDYVTFEQAKLLKEKGFPLRYEVTMHTFSEPWSSYEEEYEEIHYDKPIPPALSIVRKWLREYKDIDFEIHVHKGVSYKYYTVYMYDRKDCILDESDSPIRFEKFENALSVAINEALKMI